MADKNLQMKRKRADGGFDDYFPITKATNVKLASGTTVEAKLGALLESPVYGTATIAPVTFYGKTGSSPNYTYNIKTFSIPLGVNISSIKELEVWFSERGGSPATLYPNIDKCKYGPDRRLSPINRGYGATASFGSDTSTSTISTEQNLFNNGAIKLVDAYVSGSDLILKFTYDNTTSSMVPNSSQTVFYIMK